MNIGLIGYGKMGKTIEKLAVEKGHRITLIIDQHNPEDLNKENLDLCDVAIEFTNPESAYQNLIKCMTYSIPTVCGTTGWLDHLREIEELCILHNGSFLYSSNFSLGVNIFFALNTYLAKLMNKFPEYKPSIEEIHHIQKKDAPSGTAITLANQILSQNKSKTKWVNHETHTPSELPIISKRYPDVPGTHIIKYENNIDLISIEHEAKSREGFALGAIAAAEYIYNKKGIFTMNEVLDLSEN